MNGIVEWGDRRVCQGVPSDRALLDDEIAYLAEVEIVESFAIFGYGRTTPPDRHHIGYGSESSVGCGVCGAIYDKGRGECCIVVGCRVVDVPAVIVALANLVAQSVCNLVVDVVFDVYHGSLLVISGLQKYGSGEIFVYTIFDIPKQNLYLCAVFKFSR